MKRQHNHYFPVHFYVKYLLHRPMSRRLNLFQGDDSSSLGLIKDTQDPEDEKAQEYAGSEGVLYHGGF